MLTSLIASTALVFSLQAQATADAEQADAAATEAVATETADENEATPAPQAEAATDENKIICRRTQVIGSKFTKRICGTQAEWDELARRGQTNTREFQDRGQSIRQAGN